MSGERQDPEQAIRDWLTDSAPGRAPASLTETLEEVTTRPAGRSRSVWRMTMPHLRLAGGIAATLAILALVSSSFYLYGNSRVAGPSLQALASAAKSTTPAAPSSTSPSGRHGRAPAAGGRPTWAGWLPSG